MRFDLTNLTVLDRRLHIRLRDFVRNTQACANVGKVLTAPVNTALETFCNPGMPCATLINAADIWLEGRVGRFQEKGGWNFWYTRIFVEREAVLGSSTTARCARVANVSQHRGEAFYQAYENIQLRLHRLVGRALVTATTPASAEEPAQVSAICRDA